MKEKNEDNENLLKKLGFRKKKKTKVKKTMTFMFEIFPTKN